MATKKQTGAFLIALMEMPETVAAIARDVWGWVAALWQNHVAARPILWFLLAYVCVIASVIGWRYVEGSAFLTWEFWEKSPDGKISGPEGIRNLVWSLATLVGGAAAGIGLLLAGSRTKAATHQAEAALQQSETAFQSLVTERFTKAVEQLGHKKRAVRLGAIYALERIAKDSARDRDTIVETLAAYIRENAPWPPVDKASGHPLEGDALEAETKRTDMRPSIDIAAALNIICRLLPTADPTRKNIDLRHTDLRGLDAPGINLSRMRLVDSNLSDCSLEKSSLIRADLSKATLSRALMSEANLSYANLNKAILSNAILTRVVMSNSNLRDANLQDAKLDMAVLSNANLWGANMTKASFHEANLSGARLIKATLGGARLSNANLSGAELGLLSTWQEPSEVFGATIMKEADLSDADLSGVECLTQGELDGIRYERGSPPRNMPAGLTLPEPYDWGF